MTEDELKTECRNMLTLLDMSVLPGRMNTTYELMIFAKRMQAEGLREAADSFDSYNDDPGHYSQILQNRIKAIWARAKERES